MTPSFKWPIHSDFYPSAFSQNNGFETVFKKLKSNKKLPNSQRIVHTVSKSLSWKEMLSPFARPAVYLAGDSRMR